MTERRLRAQLFHILHKPSATHPIARYANYFLTFLIVTNALFVALETVPEVGIRYRTPFWWFEAVSTGLFIIEYLTRLWVCVEQGRYVHPVSGRLRYAVQPLPLLDLTVIVTYWMPIDLRFLRVARMVRLLKVLRLAHFEESLDKIADGLRKRRALIVVAITMMVLCIYASSSLVYQVEHGQQPAVFTSIPGTFWWAMETLTTIGYGDMVPITPLGKFFAGMISIFGIGIFALPTAIVTAAIVEAGVSDPQSVTCAHCGHPVHASRSTQSPHAPPSVQ